MHYGRIYSATFSAVAVSAVQDFFEILVGSGVVCVLHRVTITQQTEEGDAQDEMLRCSIFRVTGAPTSGSGGSTATARPFQQGDAAAGLTVEINNTTQLSGGTSVVLASEGWNVRAGWDWYPAPEDRPSFQPSTRILVTLDEAPADAITMTGTVILEEIG